MTTEPVVVLILDEATARDYVEALTNEKHGCAVSDPDRAARFRSHAHRVERKVIAVTSTPTGARVAS